MAEAPADRRPMHHAFERSTADTGVCTWCGIGPEWHRPHFYKGLMNLSGPCPCGEPEAAHLDPANPKVSTVGSRRFFDLAHGDGAVSVCILPGREVVTMMATIEGSGPAMEFKTEDFKAWVLAMAEMLR